MSNIVYLKELLEIKNGKDYRKLEKGKIPVYGTGGIITYVNDFLYDNESILLPRKGSLQNILYVNEKFWTVDTMYWSIINKEKVYPKYLFCYLSLLNLSSRDSGSTLPSMTFDAYYTLPIKLFSYEKQKKIGDLYFEITNKIKLNNKINSELENMAKTIYDYWFLQFEFPNDEGKPYKSSDGKMVWNEELKKEIPEGWEVETLLKNRISSVIRTGTEYFETKNYLATANIINEEITDGNWITYENRESRANMTPVSNSVWFAKMKNSIKHLTITDSAEWFLEKYILSTGFLGLKCNENSLGYIHCFINSKYFEPKKDSLAHGATQEAVNNEDINFIKILIPKDNILESFNKIIKPLLQKKLDNKKENQELISLRDYLLPLLMNGQVGFKD